MALETTRSMRVLLLAVALRKGRGEIEPGDLEALLHHDLGRQNAVQSAGYKGNRPLRHEFPLIPLKIKRYYKSPKLDLAIENEGISIYFPYAYI